MRLCASWADEYSQGAFVILLNFSNLAVSKQKLRPSKRQDHRIPNLRKALDVVGNADANFFNLKMNRPILSRKSICRRSSRPCDGHVLKKDGSLYFSDGEVYEVVNLREAAKD